MDYLQNVKFIKRTKIKEKNEVVKFFNDSKDILLSNDKRCSNIILNEYEIATDATILKSKPRVLKVTLKNMCNLRCIMCACHRLPIWKLPQKYKDQIIEMLPFLERVSWIGGEVFLYDYFKELIYNANKYNVRQDIITNGILIDDCMAKYFVQNNVDIEFSIDSLKPDVYKKIRING